MTSSIADTTATATNGGDDSHRHRPAVSLSPPSTSSSVPTEKQQQAPMTSNGDNNHVVVVPPPVSASNHRTSSNYKEDDDEEEPVVDEEEALFVSLEREEEAHNAVEEYEQPKNITAAPKLLQAALSQGQVKADESEEESDQEKQQQSEGKAAGTSTPQKENHANDATATTATVASSPAKTNASSDAAAATTTTPGGSPPPHVHQRGNQLDFLLSKASEYSNFIARDLDELQSAMTDKAKKTVAKAEKRQKKEAAGGGRASKKRKDNSGAALQSAQAKDAAVRAGSRPIFVQPPNLAPGCILKDYQLEGVRWLASLFENGVSGILADEMGLGKTIQCVALIAHLLTMGVSGPFLIVAPLATLPNWVREFEKWLPQHPVVRYHGAAEDRQAMLRGPLHSKQKRNPNYPFIVTSYEVAIRDQSKLEKLSEFTYVIVDEGHRLKNHRCTLLSSLKRLKASNRLLLTGTPIQNTLNELWSLLNFVNPQIFDDLRVFQSWFGFKDIGQNTKGATDERDILAEQRKNQTVSKLHEILRPFLLRRIKSDVLADMPPKKEIIVYSGMSKLQRGYADLIQAGTLRDTLLEQGIESGRTLSQTNKLMNHRKNINHPFLFGEPVDPATGIHLGSAHPQLLVRASGKFALLDRMLSRLHADGHQVLIFSQMTAVLNVMEDYLSWRRWKYCRIDGSTAVDDRQAAMDTFNAERTAGVGGTRNLSDDRTFCFLLSTRAGGLGINLTAADTCILFDSDWNPFADAQAMDRCHRLGQERPVAVYRLLTINSVDIEMMEKQVSKKKLERMTIAGGDFRKAGRRSGTAPHISFDQLQGLLRADVKDLTNKGASGDVEDVKIDHDEFEAIMNRRRLFDAENPVPSEGRMYDVIDAATGDLLGTMNA